MSWFYYFASNKKLEEQPNPYVHKLSIHEALERNVEIDMDFVEGLDFDEPDVLLYVEKEEYLEYPNIFTLEKEDYLDTDKKYCVALETSIDIKYMGVILNYINKQMVNHDEIELWKKWEGNNRHNKKAKICTCTIDELNTNILYQFFENKEDFMCMKIIK